jgi:hypothetical protein
MNDDLAAQLARLPEPIPPATLRASVMARVMREDVRRAPGEATARAYRPGTRFAWLWSVAGLAIVLCVTAYGWLDEGAVPDVLSPRIGRGSPQLLPMGPGGLLLSLGLLIYLAGLFGPLRRQR